MADRNNIKPGERSPSERLSTQRPADRRDPPSGRRDPPSSPGDGGSRPKGTGPGGATGSSAASEPSGRVVHDERGNAVWDWLKHTSRIAIESTSRLLRKLEAPELEVEDKKDQELRLESDRDPGGGYDPYNQPRSGRGRGR